MFCEFYNRRIFKTLGDQINIESNEIARNKKVRIRNAR